jgi:hypothetical protein
MKIGRARNLALFVALGVAVSAAGIVLARQPLARSERFPTLRWIVQLVVPPPDLYTPLASSPAAVGDATWHTNLRLLHKYPGNYAVNIETRPAPAFGTTSRYPVDFELELTCRGNRSDRPTSLRSTIDPAPWWRNGLERGGFTLIRYSVPEDLPANEHISCVVRTVVAGPRFQEAYASQILTVQKESEE